MPRLRPWTLSAGRVIARLFDDGDERVFHGRLAARLGAARAADFGRRALGQHAAGIHDRDAVAVFGFLHEMRGDDHGHALLGQRGDPPPEFAAGQRIGAAGRLVEKQNLRLVQQRGGHRQALLESAGQLAAGQARQRRQFELLAAPSRCGRACARRAGRRRWRRNPRFSTTESWP